jgi:predicted DNA-binding ribbon-helix-helix protein
LNTSCGVCLIGVADQRNKAIKQLASHLSVYCLEYAIQLAAEHHWRFASSFNACIQWYVVCLSGVRRSLRTVAG